LQKDLSNRLVTVYTLEFYFLAMSAVLKIGPQKLYTNYCSVYGLRLIHFYQDIRERESKI